MPPDRDNTIAVIPCLNEAATLGTIVPALAPFVHLTLVVDDGSSDDTAAVATRAGARVLRHPHPLGKGAALVTGWDQAATLGAQWVLLLDGDGQHDPLDTPALFQAASPGVTLVIGNRMHDARGMPAVRRLTNHLLSRWISTLAGTPIPDSQCGFRLVHLPTLRTLRFRSRQFELESEMIVGFARAGCRIASAPIQVRYAGEQSKISPVPDTLRWLRWYFRTRANRDRPHFR